MNYKEPDHYYSSCDYDLIGTCLDCLFDHPGNYFVQLDDGEGTCCVPDPTLIKLPHSMGINSTSECPPDILQASAAYIVGSSVLTVGIMGVTIIGKWIYNKFVKKNRVEPEVAEGIEMRDLGGLNVHGQLELNDGEMGGDVEDGEGGEDDFDSVDLGYVGDGEGTSPPLSEDERLNALCLYETDEDNESDGEERMFTMEM